MLFDKEIKDIENQRRYLSRKEARKTKYVAQGKVTISLFTFK